MLSDAELEDLAGLILSGQASLLRRVSGMTVATLAGQTGASGRRQARYESQGLIPRDGGVRERYYRVLCTLRERYGTVELAEPEPCARFRRGTAGNGTYPPARAVPPWPGPVPRAG